MCQVIQFMNTDLRQFRTPIIYLNIRQMSGHVRLVKSDMVLLFFVFVGQKYVKFIHLFLES